MSIFVQKKTNFHWNSEPVIVVQMVEKKGECYIFFSSKELAEFIRKKREKNENLNMDVVTI